MAAMLAFPANGTSIAAELTCHSNSKCLWHQTRHSHYGADGGSAGEPLLTVDAVCSLTLESASSLCVQEHRKLYSSHFAVHKVCPELRQEAVTTTLRSTSPQGTGLQAICNGATELTGSPAASSMPASPKALPTQTVPMGGLMYRIVS